MSGETLQEDLDGLRPKLFRPTHAQIYALENEAIASTFDKYYDRARSLKQTPFDAPWACRLHHDMFGKVWKWAGQYRETNLNIGVDKTHIHQRLIQLFDDLKYWRDHHSYDVLEQAVRLHHGAVFIHPFKNGNGRWARLLADLWLMQNGGERIAWPVGVDAESPIRVEYLAALRAADRSDFSALIALHRRYKGRP